MKPSPNTENSETPNSTISRKASAQVSSAMASHAYFSPGCKIMPNIAFVGEIKVRVEETKIRSFFARYGSVKEVKITTDQTGMPKGYGFVSFYGMVMQKIVEPQLNFPREKLTQGPAIRKQNICAYHVLCLFCFLINKNNFIVVKMHKINWTILTISKFIL